MKKISALLFCIKVTLTSFSQADSDLPVYIRFPNIPQFTVYKAPDSTKFTRENLKKAPAVFIIFDPFCDHCQDEAKAITANIEKFKNVQILMITYLPYRDMMQFYREYKIKNYPVITMGYDAKTFFPTFFRVRSLPAVFIYDKKGKYKKSFDGIVSLDKIIAAL